MTTIITSTGTGRYSNADSLYVLAFSDAERLGSISPAMENFTPEQWAEVKSAVFREMGRKPKPFKGTAKARECARNAARARWAKERAKKEGE
jgi:hypothetical protein